MRSSQSNISKKPIGWSSPLSSLFPKGKLGQTAKGLIESGIESLGDLRLILPLRIQKIPIPSPFDQATVGNLFKGRGRISSLQKNFSPKARGLINITLSVQDISSNKTLTLRWFNTYVTTYSKLATLSEIEFFGKVTTFQNRTQLVAPKLIPISEAAEKPEEGVLLEYPTINKIKPIYLQKLILKIPQNLWTEVDDYLPQEKRIARKLLSLEKSFQIIHGKSHPEDACLETAKKRLIYDEFFFYQIKVFLRREKNRQHKAPILDCKEVLFKKFQAFFPYALTPDQLNSTSEIRDDFKKGRPMMRLLQGDVGSGKTTVGIISSLIAIDSGKQVAFMCPTETLARQHFHEIKKIIPNTELLLGPTKENEKKGIRERLSSGKISLIIGTQSLIQDDIEFKNLAFVIIDEQHKFGVSQRLKLTAKGVGVHALIMTATPIPRSLGLTQYGDLDVSVIKTMPKGRKGHKTKIILPNNFQNFLNFLRTRIEMGEQAYIVVPAISESENQNLAHLEKVYERFNETFGKLGRSVGALHGQMKNDKKNDLFQRFEAGAIDILISTTVIEVGINVPNATIMAIMNAERFGLSSLHQLRGRVGRGHKPGFCFLITENSLSPDSIKRLEVIEQHTDGFHIAEEDLKIRGHGSLFGSEQSGSDGETHLADIIQHEELLQHARSDAQELFEMNHPHIAPLIKKISRDSIVSSTI